MVTIKKNTKLKMYETNGFSDGKTAIFFFSSSLLVVSFALQLFCWLYIFCFKQTTDMFF